jgi:hypothetical protein
MTADPFALLALAARIEALTEPSRKIDAEVEALIGDEVDTPGSHLLGGFHRGRGAYLRQTARLFTASLDAVMALKAEVRPGWDVQMAHESGDLCWANVFSDGLMDSYQSGEGRGATLACAMLAAVLRAVAAEEAS